MGSKTPKKSQSAFRAGSAANKDATSLAASAALQEKKKVIIWPEWSDADINAEKWEGTHNKKDKEKGKSPVTQQHFFEDPDGKVEYPPSLKVATWKRPQEYLLEKVPVIVEPNSQGDFNLLSEANETVHESELMRWITSQITALWKQSATKPPPPEAIDPAFPPVLDPQGNIHTWHPWEHIFAINKVVKGPYMPAYNPFGKYVVKLYWMGCWRKIYVDDTLPFDEQGRLLLPSTTLDHEIWPHLLTKALLKVASIDYNGGNSSCEFGDFSVIQCLTGWLPETIPLQYGHLPEIWNMLKQALPEFKLPELEPEKPPENLEVPKDPTISPEGTEEAKDKEVKDKPSEIKSEGKPAKEEKKGKGKEDKKKDKEKNKELKEKSMMQEDIPLPEHPEIMVFAAYSGPPKYPVRISVLGEMADASERLRQSGLSHLYPHPVLVKQTRSCPLEPPPPPEKTPAWKLFRPRKKKQTPTDEPHPEEEKEPIMSLEITSPFVNYKVSPIPIPKDTHRPKSSLERHGTRPNTANPEAIEETDENAPAGQESTEKVKEEPKPIKREERPPKEVIAPPPPKPEQKEPKKEDKKEGKEKKEPKEGKEEKKKGGSKENTQDGGKEKKSEKLVPPPVSEANMSQEGSVMEEGVPEEGAPEEEVVITEPEQKPPELWMDFEVFCKCFKTLYIYHKPLTYLANVKHSDLKGNVSTGKGGDKKSAPSTAAGPPVDEKAPHYLFVDNLKQTEIVVSFSSLSRWNEPPQPAPTKEESKVSVKGKDKGDKAREIESRQGHEKSGRDSTLELASADGSLSVDHQMEPKPPEPIQPGILVAEPYSWKSLVTGQPILRLRSTASRAAVLCLPEGRHVLRFHMSAPLGYHVHLCSSTPFVFGDEEKVMAELVKESFRFIDNASQVMVTMGKCIQNFCDPNLFTESFEDFFNAHCPYRQDKHFSKIHHMKIFNESLYGMLKKTLGEANLLTPEMAWAWRTFTMDLTNKNILGLTPQGTSRPATAAPPVNERGSAVGKKSNKRQEKQDGKLEHLLNREITPEEHVAAVKIQCAARGYLVRKMAAGRTPGTEDNAKIYEQLMKAWAVMEPKAEENGLFLFRSMFKADPELMPRYPFYKDEWNKISYADYQGNYTDQPPNTWFVVFRDIFYVTEEMLCVPKLYVPFATCMLRVINNDNGEEIPRVFQKVAPYVYKRNKSGYTFIAEGRTTETAIPAGRWRMRLIGGLSPLPAPQKSEINCSFHTRELRDYYVPNEKNIILRYTVKTTEDHLTSLQVSTSKPDVYVKLVVLDNDTEIISAVGKSHVVLPAYIFKRDSSELETSRPSSRSSMKTKKKKRSISAESKVSTSESFDEEDEIISKHKYVIQAVVLRNSWPLSESSWAFVQNLKELEKKELKLDYKEKPSSARADRSQAATATPVKATKEKGKGKAAKAAEKDKDKVTSRPSSQQFDLTKPFWTLRIVTDGEDLDVKKDTERADEIRSMKKAREEAEPGRAAKAMQSRLQYLSTHMVKVDDGSGDTDSKTADTKSDGVTSERSEPPGSRPLSAIEPPEAEQILTLVPPAPPPPKQILAPLDISPFLKKTRESPIFLDEEVERELFEQKQKELQNYRQYREEVEAMREKDRINRNLTKVKQLEQCEKMQEILDNARESINKPREAFRQKFLEAERKRLEEIAAAEAALLEEQQKNAPSPKGKKSGKDKKPNSGKNSGKKKK